MAKRKQMPRDLNQRAKAVVDLATSDDPLPEKDEVRAEAGRKGGTSRARKLTRAERTAIARKGAAKRWGSDG